MAIVRRTRNSVRRTLTVACCARVGVRLAMIIARQTFTSAEGALIGAQRTIASVRSALSIFLLARPVRRACAQGLIIFD